MLALLCLTGCDRHFFHATGALTSDGAGKLDAFSERPKGCTREPWDGLTRDRTNSILTLLWEDNNSHGFAPTDIHRPLYGDRPIRMDIGRAPDGSGLTGILNTVKLKGLGLDAKSCRTFQIGTHEQPAAYPEGQPALAGTLTLDCTVRGSRLTADVGFERCEY